MGKKASLHLITTINKRFSSLTVIGPPIQLSGERIKVLCKCDCGVERYVRCLDLVHNNTKSCGCLNRDTLLQRNTKHGLCNTNTYITWCAMKSRCLNFNNQDFRHYGGRGITICREWLKFENFIRDMGEAPSTKHTIDRINNYGNYQPDNCRWATRKEQANNLRKNILLTHNGETKTLQEWSAVSGINSETISHRIKTGWTINDAITTQVKTNEIKLPKGVRYDDKKYQARIGLNNKRISLGYFDTVAEASEAYIKKAKELYGDTYKKTNQLQPPLQPASHYKQSQTN